jgi:hypothetical protein
MRVFIGMTEVSGFCTRLADGFRSLGHDVTTVSIPRHPFGYEEDTQMPFLPLALADRVSQWSIPRIGNRPRQLAVRAVTAAAVPQIFSNFDLIILVFGTRVASHRDGLIARRFGAKVVHVLLGSDARPPEIDSITWRSGTALNRRRNRVRRTVQTIEKASDAVVALPAYAHFVRGPYIDLLSIGLPVDTTSCASTHNATGQLRVLHAPSNPEAKGTNLIRMAVEIAVEHGAAIEYSEISGASQSRVRETLIDCDVLIDQCFSDTPLAMLASEAIAHGVLPIVGTLHEHQLWNDRTPLSIVVHPSQIAQVLKDLASNPTETRMVARALQSPGHQWSDPALVAQRLLDALEHGVHRTKGTCCNTGFGNHERRPVSIQPPTSTPRSASWWLAESGKIRAGTPTTSE